MSIVGIIVASLGLLIGFILQKLYSTSGLPRKANALGLSLLSSVKCSFALSNGLANWVKANKLTSGFYYFWFGSEFTLLAVDADAAQFVLKNNSFVKSDLIIANYSKSKLGRHIVFANGEDWKRHRQLVNAGFNSESYKEYYPIFQEVLGKLLMKVAQYEGQDIEIFSWLSKFTLDVLGKSIFHYDFQTLDTIQNPMYNHYRSALNNGTTTNAILTLLFPIYDSLPLPGPINAHHSVDEMEKFLLKVIQERKEYNKIDTNPKFNDILDRLLEGSENLSSLSPVEFLSDIWVFFAAGHETTATALKMAIAELADKQDLQERLYREIMESFGNEIPPFEGVTKDVPPFLEGFVLESMRVHPAIPQLATRMASEDVPYEKQLIPKGARVGLDIHSIHHNPLHWEDPERFDPERFTPEKKKGRHKFAYLPFSLGQRQCLGNDFSEIEQKLCLVRLLQQFKVLPSKSHPKFNLKHVDSLGRPNPLYVRLERRL